MQVLGKDTVRGRSARAQRLQFDVSGGFPPIRVADAYDSWLDVETLNSLRFVQKLDEAGKKRHRDYMIDPERAVFRLDDHEEKPSVPDPLDDASFLFFVRTIPLEVGKDYTFNRYFDPQKANPVMIIKVLRKDTIDVPAGRFPAIVVQPIIKTSGLFSQDGHAEIWLSDDNRRILLEMKTRLAGISSRCRYERRSSPPIRPARRPRESDRQATAGRGRPFARAHGPHRAATQQGAR